MKEWKPWKLILLFFGTYFGLNIIILVSMFGISGQIGDLFGSSDSLGLWVNYVFGHSLASPSVKVLFSVNEFVSTTGWLVVHIIHYVVPGIVCAILVGWLARNSRIAFFIPFLFFIVLSMIIVVLAIVNIPLISYTMLTELVPPLATANTGIVVTILILIGLFQSIFYGGIAGLTRNILSR